jgi:hypothetical protein
MCRHSGFSLTSDGMKIRDRIRELRRVKASDLVPHPGNRRVHGKAQTAALKGLLAEVGYADALLARELPGGKLMLIDLGPAPELIGESNRHPERAA